MEGDIHCSWLNRESSRFCLTARVAVRGTHNPGVAISRLTSLSDSGNTLESFDYLGLDTVVRRAHSQPGVDLTYIKQSGESNGDAGDQYTGLDRFGRVVDQRWRKTSDGSHTDRFKYGYDRCGNPLYRENIINAVFSELYHANGASGSYDGLDQLLEFRRGTLSDTNSDGVSDTVATASRSQVWSLDPLGNFSSVTTDAATQTRTHNRQNQITSISGQTTPAYDGNGNTITDQTGKTLIYDAWNRLVRVKNGDVTLITHAYDGLNRRISENSGTARLLYYSSDWQIVEERESGLAVVQHVWSPVYTDGLVLRDRDSNGDGTLEERLYVQHDANYNVTALINAAGAVVERFVQDPFGSFSVLAPDWSARASSLYGWLHLHQGGRYTSATDLYHFRNRDYAPALGRWLKLDPLGYGARDNNFYRYEKNSPTANLDPLGLVPFYNTPCQWAPPTSSTAGCGIHRGIVFTGFNADCVCRCAGSSDWDNSVRGCLNCAQRAGVPPSEAHDQCFMLADARYGVVQGILQRLDIFLNCDQCAACPPNPVLQNWIQYVGT